MRLHQRAAAIVDRFLAELTPAVGVELHRPLGALVIDAGVAVRGSFRAARLLADTCLAGLARIELEPGRVAGVPTPSITVELDDPLIPCLLSQYAGQAVQVGDFFGMGSGPFRAALATEPVFAEFGFAEPARADDRIVVVLETSTPPGEAAVTWLAERLRVEPARLILLTARTASLAGSFQVVARSVETCLHKLHELHFDVRTVKAAFGSAPLPTIPKSDRIAIGRTNDAILYGGTVSLWVDADDAMIEELGPRVPSSASADHGRPFVEIFERAGRDFYRIDKLLFSPAEVVFHNLRTGTVRRLGHTEESLLAESFFGTRTP
jgi:methenyltetrahydromethanopterin cyclohydrolase